MVGTFHYRSHCYSKVTNKGSLCKFCPNETINFIFLILIYFYLNCYFFISAIWVFSLLRGKGWKETWGVYRIPQFPAIPSFCGLARSSPACCRFSLTLSPSEEGSGPCQLPAQAGCLGML